MSHYRTSEAHVARLLNPDDPRKFYIGKGSTKISDKNSDAVAYLEDRPNVQTGKMRYFVVAFVGKQTKPIANFYYTKPETRAAKIKEIFDGRQASMKYKAEQREANKQTPDYAVGDVFGTCWGYDQTNVEFYEIVAIKGKTATLRELAQDRKETHWAQGHTVPLPGKYIGEAFEKRITPYGFKISSCQRATPESFDTVAGVKVYKPRHWSAYA
jgi:hypothetical protein